MENTQVSDDKTGLLVDEPISGPEQDRLNRLKFAEHLSNVLLSHEDNNCIIAALHGEWGCGKSSVLNLIEGFLKAQKDNGEDIIILRFNPWNASDLEQLIAMFFRELKISIVGVEKNKQTKENIGKLLDIFSGILTVAQLSPVGNQYFSMGSALTNKLKGMLKDTPKKTQEEIKKQLDGLLSGYAKRIFIVVDDIDRLDIDAMKLLFRLIRLNANFKNTTYLLAFDRNLVEDMLECEQPGHGKEYVDKIVQVPIHVPSPDEGLITDILIGEIIKLRGKWKEEDFDDKHWEELYMVGHFRKYFKNIRNIIRYVNGLEITYPLVSSEVNMVDFMGLNLIRTFAPLSYEMIRKNKGLLTVGETGEFSRRESVEVAKEIIRRIYNSPLTVESSEKERELAELVKNTCKVLFPKISSIEGDFILGGGREQEWKQQKRICSTEYFEKYFMLGAPIHTISDEEMRLFVATAGDAEYFYVKLMEFFERDMGTRVLEKLEDYVVHINEDHIEGVIIAIFNAEDKIVGEPRSMMMMGADLLAVRIVLRLLERIEDSGKRKQILLSAIEKCPNVYLPMHFVSLITPTGGEGEKVDEKEVLGFSSSDLREIQEKCLHKVKSFVGEGRLSKEPHLNAILFRWIEWENVEVVKVYVDELLRTDEGLWDFLIGFTSEVLSTAGDYKNIRQEEVRVFADFEDAEKRIKEIVAEPGIELSDKKKEVVAALENSRRRDLH